MRQELRPNLTWCCFLAAYALLYMSNAVFGTFLPVYLGQAGYDKAAIGTILALGPFVTMLAQPVWGLAGDRAKAKNNVLMVLALGSAVTALMFGFSTNYIYLLAIMAASTFFKSSVSPLTDAVTLEYLETTGWKFSTIRMAGTVGYALMSIIAGYYAKRNIDSIFILFFIISLMFFAVLFRLPIIKGHQSADKKVSMFALMKNRELVLLLVYCSVVQMTMSFYYSFFSLYFKEIGGDNGTLGWTMFISAICEVPFLLFANRIISRFGTRKTLFGSGVITATRWILLFFIKNPVLILPLQIMHGLSFIVVSYSMITYINEKVPKELKASGQALFNLLTMGAASIIANLLGGYISGLIGIRLVFLYNGCLILITVVIVAITSRSEYIKGSTACESLQ